MTNEPLTRKSARLIRESAQVRNALAFIVESIADHEVESSFSLRTLDFETLHEFAEDWDFDKHAFDKAMNLFQRAFYQEELANRDANE